MAPRPAAAQQVSERRVRAALEDVARGLGQAVAGGSPLTAPAATTGGLGHFHLGASGALTRLEIEDPQRDSGTLRFVLPVGTANAALGLWKGWSLAPGISGTGALDLIGRAGPVVARQDLADNALLFAAGLRVGLLGEGTVAPAVSVSAFRAWTERLEYGDPAGDDVSFSGEVSTVSLRADLSKALLFLTPYAGAGIDRTQLDAAYRIPPSSGSDGPEIQGRVEPSSTHQKFYAGLQFGLLALSASVEIGVYDGGGFGAAGLRLGF
ncbi:MAG: hypothetical protein ABR559_09070 [Gemmatimonadota bacterium]